MTAFASPSLSTRQILVQGKVSEAVTGRRFTDFETALSFSHAAGQGILPARLQTKPGGHYALHLDPVRDLRDLSKNGQVTLTLTVTVAGRAPFVQAKRIPAAKFALVSRPVRIGTQMLDSRVLVGAPFAMDFIFPAAPVGLRGIVLNRNDPEAPLAGVKVRAGTAPQVLTGANGRFVVTALPITETVDIELEGTGPVETVVFRPDYDIPVNTITLSLGS